MFGAARQALFLANPAGGGVFTSASLLSTLTNPNAGGDSGSDSYGYVTATSNSYVAVSAYTESGGGKVYLYDTSGSFLRTISNPSSQSGSQFGYSIALTDDYLVVGCNLFGGTAEGRVYVFNPSTGSLLYTKSDPNPYSSVDNDYFGQSVGVAGNYMIAGAIGEDEAAGTNSGKAYIFDLTDGSLTYTLDNPNNYNTVASDQFGYRVAIGDSYAVVAVPLEDSSGGTSSGVIYIYDLSDGSLAYTVVDPNPYGTTASDQFGYSVDMSGNTIVVGAYLEDDAGGTTSGKVYIIDASTGSITYTLDNPNPYGTSANDAFGSSVTIFGDLVAVSAPAEDESSATNSGKIYIYSASTGSLLQTIDNPNAYGTADNDNIGSGPESLSISHDRLTIGAYQEDSGNSNTAGKAYIFELNYS